MLYLLDTDTCVAALRHENAVLSRLAQLSPDDVAVSTVTEAELFYGALLSRDPVRTRAAVEAFLAPLIRLPFSGAAAARQAELRYKLRAPIGERELIIASIAHAMDATIVTHSLREFGLIPGLVVQDWLCNS